MTKVAGQVFAIGADERHIVVKQHAASGLITNYYVVNLSSAARRDPLGPLTEEKYSRLDDALNLPEFFSTFPTLVQGGYGPPNDI